MSNTQPLPKNKQSLDSAIKQTLDEIREAQRLLKLGKRITRARLVQAEQELKDKGINNEDS